MVLLGQLEVVDGAEAEAGVGGVGADALAHGVDGSRVVFERVLHRVQLARDEVDVVGDVEALALDFGLDAVAFGLQVHLRLHEGVDCFDLFLELVVQVGEAGCAADVGDVDLHAGDGGLVVLGVGEGGGLAHA